MDPHDDEMERSLKEFRPRAIRALEIAAGARSILLRRLAAAAAVALLTGGLLWFAHRKAARLQETANVQPAKVNVRIERRYASTLALTRLALADNEKLETILAEESRKTLPTVRGVQSTLKVLAKD
jgi:hypothetical protein